MAAFKILTLLFISAGALIMLVSALSTGQIIRRLETSRYLATWKLLSILMALFLVGYVAAGLLLALDYTEPVLLLTGAVFFFGAFFVYLVVRIGYLTIEEDHEIKTDLQRHGAQVERKLADRDQQVETTEARYRLLVENSGLPIIYIGLEGTLFFVNRDGARLLHQSAASLVGAQIKHLMPKQNRRILAGIRRAARTPGGAVYEMEIPLPDGPRWFLAVCRPIHSEQGPVIAVQIVAQDVTDRRRAEQKIREQKEIYDQILDNMGTDLALFDDGLRYEYVNPRGIKDPEMRAWLVGRTNSQYVERRGWDPKIAEERDRIMERVFAEKKEIRFEEENVTPAGDIRNVLRVLTPIFNRAGDVIKLVGQGIDITEQKRVQRELAAARDRAEEGSRAKSEFLTNMSHEIRTPLNAVLGMGELLAETDLTPEQRKFVDISRKAGDNLLLLINDILDLSRIESGRLEVESIPFTVTDLATRTVAGIEESAREKGLRFSVEIAPETPEYLRGDPVRMRQILGNLVANAVKFTERGSVTFRIQPRAGTNMTVNDAGDDSIEMEFRVEDTGPGIAPDARESIFNSFVQADSSTTRRFGGTGLGLAISRRLADLLGGRIELESDTGVGSVFSFILRLPPALPDVADDRAVQEKNNGIEADAGDLAVLRVLLVEDHPDNQLLISAFLKHTPCELDLAQNGQEALEYFRVNHYDLVLLDMQMPVMDGYTAAGQMRSFENETNRKRTPVIALTAHALKDEEEKCLRAGCDRHLAKPIRKSVLLDLLAEFAPRT